MGVISAMVVSSFGDLPAAAGGGIFQRRGPLNVSFFVSVFAASEADYFRLWLPGLLGPDPGDFLCVQKVTKKALGRPQTPFFVQSDAPKL